MQKIKVIIGASYGDEGKGLATDFCAAKEVGNGAGTAVTSAGYGFSGGANMVTVLTNGGPQRGHTVELPDGRRHVFKHFGSASFRGSETYFGRRFLVNPMEFVREYGELEALHAAPRAHCDPQCRFSTPYDMLMNRMLSEKSGNHNSCGFGIWETVLRYSKGWGLSFGSFCRMDYDDRRAYLVKLRDQYFGPRMKACGIAEAEFKDILEIFYSEGLLRHYLEDAELMQRLCPLAEEGILRAYGKVLFENGQGLLLDGMRAGEEDFTTPSRTGAAGAVEIIERTFSGADVEVLYVTRSYLTRHGDGQMENEIAEAEMSRFMPGIRRDATNATNRFQGRLRYGRITETGGLADRILKDFSECRSTRGNLYRPSVMVTHMNESDDIETGQLGERVGRLYLSDGKTVSEVQTAFVKPWKTTA